MKRIINLLLVLMLLLSNAGIAAALSTDETTDGTSDETVNTEESVSTSTEVDSEETVESDGSDSEETEAVESEETDGSDASEDGEEAIESEETVSTEEVSSAAEVFTDIETDEDFEEPVSYLYDQTIFKGYADGTFRPFAVVNRAELMKILVVGQGIEPDSATYKECFPDVQDEWFAPYVCYAKEQEWVVGYPDGNFYPAKKVNRAEATKMILSALGVELKEDSEDGFDDVESNVWYAKYAKTIRFRKLLDWTRFEGGKGMTRSEVAILLYRLLVITQQDAQAFSENLVSYFDTELPVDVIALKNRVVEETKERLRNAKSLVDEGIQLGLDDKWEEALSKFNSALILAPRYGGAWAGKAYSHYKLDEVGRSRFSINTALLLNFRRPIFYAIKATILYKLDMPLRAENHLKIAYKMREKLNLTTDPLPALEDWDNYTEDELRDLTEQAIEDWAWNEELSAGAWTTEYSYDEDVEREGTDETE